VQIQEDKNLAHKQAEEEIKLINSRLVERQQQYDAKLANLNSKLQQTMVDKNSTDNNIGQFRNQIQHLSASSQNNPYQKDQHEQRNSIQVIQSPASLNSSKSSASNVKATVAPVTWAGSTWGSLNGCYMNVPNQANTQPLKPINYVPA
jgi:transcriptional regulator with AAA-type ATPase domain